MTNEPEPNTRAGEALKPCPWCNAELTVPTPVQHPKMGLARLHPGSIDDGSCPIAGWGFYAEQLERWNTRAQRESEWLGCNAVAPRPQPSELVGDLTDKLGPDTDFDEHGFTIKRGNLRKLLAQLAKLQADGDKLADGVRAAIEFGCPVCGGDCASANPPVSACPIRDWTQALTEWKDRA